MHDEAQWQAAGNEGCPISGGRGAGKSLLAALSVIFPFITLITHILRTEAERVKKNPHISLPPSSRDSKPQHGEQLFLEAHPFKPPHGISYLPHVQQTTLPPKIFINADSQLKWLQIKAESVIIERVLSWMTIKRHLIRGPAKTQL